MMPCTEVRELLLEAEPEELRGVGASALAEHLRACRACARIAERILAETRMLDAYLEDAPPPPLPEILRRAGVARASEGAPAVPAKRTVRRRWLWAPAAAAAAFAALFVALESRGPVTPSVSTTMPAEPPPVVEPASSATVAVMQTDNPDITVLWFF